MAYFVLMCYGHLISSPSLTIYKCHSSDRQGKWHFAEVSGTHHMQRHSAKVPEETILARSGIQHSITDQAIDQWRDRLNVRVKAKAKHFEHLSYHIWIYLSICYDRYIQIWRIWIHVYSNMTFNACITGVIWTDWHMFCFTR